MLDEKKKQQWMVNTVQKILIVEEDQMDLILRNQNIVALSVMRHFIKYGQFRRTC